MEKERWRMRKLFALVLALAMVLSAGICAQAESGGAVPVRQRQARQRLLLVRHPDEQPLADGLLF
jgi:hypothetical protein